MLKRIFFQIKNRECYFETMQEIAYLAQSCKRASFWSPNPARDLNHKPEPGPRPIFIFESRFRPESQIYRVSQDMRNSGVSKTQCTGVAAGTRFYHTRNSNHLDQNIGLNNHKLSLLVKNNSAECNVFSKITYHETIHDGALGIKETI